MLIFMKKILFISLCLLIALSSCTEEELSTDANNTVLKTKHDTAKNSVGNIR